LRHGYLPGSITFDPLVERVDAKLASRIVWFDSLVTNVDRTPRNTNMLIWHKELWLIDHGASLYFQHAWTNWKEQAERPFVQIKDHVLLPQAGEIEAADAEFSAMLTPDVIESIAAAIPTEWLESTPRSETPEEQRSIYAEFLKTRLASSAIFVEEAQNARKSLV
jgi:hypothetical protein